jgi:hypothetical protein
MPENNYFLQTSLKGRARLLKSKKKRLPKEPFKII